MALQKILTRRMRTCLLGGAGLAFAVLAANVSFGDRGESEQPVVRRHILICPDFDPTTASGCEIELNAYVSALAALNTAQQNADDAYEAWVYCEYGLKTPPKQDVIGSEYSVLVKE